MARIGTAFVSIEGDFGPLRRQLAGLQRGRDAIEIKVTADIDRSSFARAAVAGGRLGGTKEVKLKADVDMSSFARARAVTAVLMKESNKLGDVFNRSNLSIGHWIGILGAASPVIMDVAGALGALTASLGAAVAGLGTLAVGAASAATVGLGGIAAIAIPAISSLKDLMTAQDAATKAQVTGAGSAARAAESSAQQIKAAQEQVASATRGVATAEDQLQQAQQSEKVAQEELTLARKDAVRELQDMKRAAIEGATSEKRARLSLEQAQQNLQDLQASGTASSLDLRDAELSIVEARQSLRDVTIQSNRDQKDYNKAQRGGIEQMPGVVSAQQSLDDAIRGVHDAQLGVAQAHRDVADALQNLAEQQKQANMATAAGGTSLAALALAQKKAGPAAVKFAQSLRHLSRRWKELTLAGREDFFGMLTDGLKRTEKFLPLLAKSAKSSMAALRDGLDQFLKKATGPGFKKFINVMTVTFAKSIEPIAGAFGNIAIVLERLAVAVAPDVVRMARGFEEMTKGWADSTRNAKNLRETVHGLVNQANTWWKLIKAAGELIVAVLVPGMGKGKQAVQGVTDQLKQWTNWVNAHPKEMRDFFKEALKTTGQLADLLISFVPQLFQVSTAMRPIARLFLGLTKALNSIKIGNVSALTALLGVIVGAKIITAIKGITAAYGALKVAALGAAAAEAAATAGGAGGAFAGAKGLAPGLASGAAGTAAGTAMGTAFALAVPAAIIAAGTFTKGGILDTIKGDPFGGAGKEMGNRLGDSYSREMTKASAGIPEMSVKQLMRERRKLEQGGEQIGHLAALGVDKGLMTNLNRTRERLQATITHRIAAMKFGDTFARAIASSKRPVKAATGGLIDTFKNLNNESKDVFFKSVHRYVQAMVRSGQISKAQGRKVEDYWKGVRKREARQWDKFIGNIKSAFSKGLRDFQNFAINWKFGDPKEKRHARKQAGDFAGDLGRFLGGGRRRHHAHGGLVRGFAKGGVVGTDTVPAMLTPGEFVLKRSAVKKWGLGLLMAMNRFQHGGPVGGARRSRRHQTLAVETGDLDLGLDRETKRVASSVLKIKDTLSGIFKAGEKVGKETRKTFDESFAGVGKDTHEHTSKLKGDATGQFQTLQKNTAKATNKLRRETGQDFSKTTKDAIDRTSRMKGNVTDGFQKMRGNSVQASGQMKQGVAGNFQSMAGAVGDGLGKIAKMTNSALKALGVKTLSFGVGVEKDKKAPRKQSGGLVVPGLGTGDTVPLHIGGRLAAMVEPREVIHVTNRKAAEKLEVLNKKVPRFRQGGFVPHLATGGMTAMVAEANKFEHRHYPYVLGGGHGGFGIQPVDCSGAVSDVLHAAGLLKAPMVSGDLMSWGKAGKGALTVYSSPEHVVMSLNGKFFGTSGSNPGGGAGWIEGGSPALVSGGVSRTMDVAGGAIAEGVKKVLLKGAAGPLKDMGQAVLDKVRAAANRFIEKKTPAGAFGGGDVGAGDYTGSLDKVFPHPGGPTISFNQAAMLAELAGLPGVTYAQIAIGESALRPGAISSDGGYGLWQMTPRVQSASTVAAWKSIGSYFNPWDNARMAKHLAGSGTGTSNYFGIGSVTDWNKHYTGPMPSSKRRLARGGIVAPYVGKFHTGGWVEDDGLALLKKGELVVDVPGLKRGGEARRPNKGGLGFGALERIQKKIAKAISERGALAILDERIDVTQRTAESSRSPSGSEMSKGEIADQIGLQKKLLAMLTKTRNLSEGGLRIIKRSMSQLERQIKHLHHKLDGDAKKGSKTEKHIQHLGKLIKREKDKKHPDRKKIERWTEDIKKTQKQGKPSEKKAKKLEEELARLVGKSRRFKAMTPSLTETLIEMQGLTGKSGRILDAKLTLQELKDAAKPQPLHIEELLAFAEAMRFGAFKSNLPEIPTFAEGGLHKGGLAMVGERGPEIAELPRGTRVHPSGSVSEPTVEVNFAGDAGWLREFVDVQIKHKDRKTASRYRAGQVRR